jgi:hypothetical protein
MTELDLRHRDMNNEHAIAAKAPFSRDAGIWLI